MLEPSSVNLQALTPALTRTDGGGGGGSSAAAAVRLQKVYRSYRTRRRLADTAVVAEGLWWQAIEYVRLNHRTVSFFDQLKPESPASKWNRIGFNASKVGKGLCKDSKATKLAFQHWIEAIDPRHRYGHNLQYYYEEWCKSDAGQPFFYWLDIGSGRNIDLKECPRSLLREQCIIYLGPQERDNYEYVPLEGKLIHKLTGELLDTTKQYERDKWIFVLSTSKKLYVGRKRKGTFHHSSFLAGAATLAAGRIISEKGLPKCIWAYSGHYRPSDESIDQFLNFLGENGFDKTELQINSSFNEELYEDYKQVSEEKMIEQSDHDTLAARRADVALNSCSMLCEDKAKYMRTFSGGLTGNSTDLTRNVLLKRISSMTNTSSSQLGYRLSSNWCSGAGPRIGSVADYSFTLRAEALEFVNLSVVATSTSSHRCFLNSVCENDMRCGLSTTTTNTNT